MPRPEPAPLTNGVVYHPLSGHELTTGYQPSLQLSQLGLAPLHKTFQCGSCGNSTNGRVLCKARRQSDSADILWCWCSCDKQEPTVLIEKGGELQVQHPTAREFQSNPQWPEKLRKLFDEASLSLAAGAFTACAMVARKLLMAAACEHGQPDGESFQFYVRFITDDLLKYPQAKITIDKLREIGNDANHDVAFVSREDASKAMTIVKYMLNTIYVTA